MNPDTIRGYCDEIDRQTQAIRDELLDVPVPPEPVEELVITDPSDLQVALTAGGRIALAPDLVCTAAEGYSYDTPAAALRGQGDNTVAADSGPALRVPVGLYEVSIESLAVVASSSDCAIRLGKNDTSQTTLEQAPRYVRVETVHSMGLRGKRAIEVNAAHVEILGCDVRDVYSPSKQDSQAIWIGNAPGPVLVDGGYYEAASECLMVGGDAMKIPNCRPTGITICNATFCKPLVWQGDAAIPVKNLLELKDGHDVLIEECDLVNCWKSAQDGYALMFTPTRGGSLRNVVVRNCRVSNVGGIVNVTGIDDDADNPPRTQIAIYGGEYRTNEAAMGGSGRFALIGRGPESFVVETAFIRHEGGACIDVADDAPVDALHIIGSDWNYGSYGIRIGGYNHGDNSRGQVRELIVEENTITGAHSSFRERYPDNVYVSAMSREREYEVDRHAKAFAHETAEELKRVRRWLAEYVL